MNRIFRHYEGLRTDLQDIRLAGPSGGGPPPAEAWGGRASRPADADAGRSAGAPGTPSGGARSG